jgi:gluconolactonase
MHRVIPFVFLAVGAILPLHAQDRGQSAESQRQTSRYERIKDRGENEILAPGKHWDLLGEGYQLTADSAVDRVGNVYFTDARNNRILKIDLEGKISTWKEPSNGAHGIAFGPDNRLYAGQHDRKRIVAFSSDGTESLIAEGVQTHHLTVTSRNDIYFSEPPTHKVWLVDDMGHKRVVHDGLNWPRGIRASPDQSILVVNNARTRFVWSFQIQADGSLINGQPFYGLETSDPKNGSDAGGMVFDSEGFLYVATNLGVQVCDKQGRVAVRILTLLL